MSFSPHRKSFPIALSIAAAPIVAGGAWLALHVAMVVSIMVHG